VGRASTVPKRRSGLGGEAAGRFWGTVATLAIGAIIVVILALASFF
jgi:hypothetical protein